MLSRAALDEVSEVLNPGDFSVPAHEAVYAATRSLHDADKPTDVVAVVDELIRRGELLGNLDASYVHGLTDGLPTSANASYYAAMVKAASKRRRLRTALDRGLTAANNETASADDALEVARAALEEVDADTSRGVEAIGDWYLSFLSGLEEKPSYTPTPWYDLNQLIYGFRDGGMYVVAADTGNGKTVVALQIARALAEHRPVLYVSLEMGRDEIAARLAAQTGQVFLGSINRHQLAQSDWRALEAHRQEIERLPLSIVTSDEVSTIPQIKAKVRATSRRFKRNPVVVVDYLQLLTSHTQVENRQQEVAGFSRSLKLAAQQWGVPVIALSQLRRGQVGQRKQEPTLNDLRESGQIANDADVVLLLHRKPVKAAADELKVIVGKNRQGQTGEASLVFQGQFARVLSKYQANEQINFEQRSKE